jgi:exopolyphosphatase/guanosine-5'-triphosphate,3'-diphosphate pyrophosphatase
MRVAAMDVGTNSVHMIVAQVDPDGHFRVLDRAKEMVRLGRNGLTHGRLTKPAMDAGVRSIAQFKTLAERQGATRIRAVATSAVREARNGGDFIQRVKEQTGIRLKVIPGREEARLIWLGAVQAIDLRGEPAVILDIGGGSVELIVVEGGQPTALHSLKLGCARMTERFLSGDPPTARSVKVLDAHLRHELEPALHAARRAGARRVIATSGTMLCLVSMAAHRLGVHPGKTLHGVTVAPSEVARLAKTLRESDRERRVRLKGMDAKRVDLIYAGAAVADHVLRGVRATSLTACTWALREGILVDYIQRHGQGIEESAKFADVRRRSVARLLRRLGYHGPHHEHVAKLSLRIFDQLRDRLGLSPAHRELLEYAALLHDVGHLIGREDHYLHSYYLIVHGELFGFTREEVEVVGQVALHHHRRGNPKPSPDPEVPLPASEWKVIRALSSILRLAEGLDRSHWGIVSDVRVSKRREGGAVLELRTDGYDAALEVWEAGRRTELLAKLLGGEVRLRVSARR